MALLSLIYVSSAVTPFTPPQLAELLAKSRRNNEAAGLSGLLLYKDGNFMQVLEGEEEAVDQLYRKLEKDPRHRGLMVIGRRPATQREFGNWSMAFRNLEDAGVRSAAGYSEFLNLSLTDPSFGRNPTAAQRLLLTFRENMR